MKSKEYSELPGNENKVSKTTKFGYSVGHVLNDLCAALWFTYGLLFYDKVAGMTAVNAGAALLIGQIADAIATPLVGYTSDRQVCLNNKYGKRKTWHLIGTISIFVSLPFMYSPCIGCQEARDIFKMIYYCSFIIVFQWGWAFVQISHLSLVPELTSDFHERTVLLSLRTTFAVLSNITVYVVAWLVLAVDAKGEKKLGPKDMPAFQIIVWSVLGTGAFTTILFHSFVKEKRPSKDDDGVAIVQPRQTYREIFERGSLYLLAVLYLCARLYGNMIQSLIPLYIHDVLQLDAQNLAAVPFTMYISSFLTSFSTGPLNKKCGRKVAYTIAGIVATCGIIGIGAGSGYIYNTYLIYVVAVFLGCSQCIFLVTSLACIADFIGEDTGNGAFIYGIMSFTDKLGSGAVIMIVQGLSPEVSSGSFYYRWATTTVCSAAVVVGVLATWCAKIQPKESTNQNATT